MGTMMLFPRVSDFMCPWPDERRTRQTAGGKAPGISFRFEGTAGHPISRVRLWALSGYNVYI